MGLRRSPLHDLHVAAGAKFAEFGGWQMPLEYPPGILAEHRAVREAVGLFDVSHLGKVRVRGAGARAFLNAVLTNDLDRVGPGRAQYTLLCDPVSGGVIDDLLVYLIADDDLVLVPNAANAAAVVGVLEERSPDGVSVRNEHDDLAIIAVQGPASDAVLAALDLPVAHPAMSFVPGRFADVDLLVCRSGYTGELGYELIAPVACAGEVWEALIAAGADHGMLPCGLGARDTLRLEMGFPLHGQDVSLEITPVQARLGWAVGWDKPSFLGRDALLAEKASGPRVTLRGLVASGRGIPRPDMSVRLARDLPVGRITSGTFSPTLRKGIALALIDPQVADGAEVTVDVRGRAEVFVVTRPPFITSGRSR